MGANSVWTTLQSLNADVIKGVNKDKTEAACNLFLKDRNIVFESYDEIGPYFARRPSLKATMLLITVDRPWDLDFHTLRKVLLPGRVGMAMLRGIYGRDKLIDALVAVCVFIFVPC